MNVVKVPRKTQFFRRLDKLSLLEYLGVQNKRQSCKPIESVGLELINYMQSSSFNDEFAYSLSNQDSKFLFFLVNLRLVVELGKSKANLLKGAMNRLQWSQYSLPISFWGLDLVTEFARVDQIEEHYNYLIEQEEVNRLIKLEGSSMKRFKALITDVKEQKESSKTVDKLFFGSTERTEESEKLYLFFKAHYNYLDYYSSAELLSIQINWGLEETHEIGERI